MATPQTDPAVTIPAAVKAAAAAAEAYYKKPAPDAPKDELKITEAAPDAPAEAPAPVEAKPVEPAPATSEVTAPPSTENWEHAYRSMKGRHDKAQEQIRALSEQVTNLNNVIATLQVAQPAPAPATPTPSELRAAKLLTPEEEANYGSDFLNVVGKKAKEELNPEVAALRQQVATLEKKLEGVGHSVVQDARSRMFATLDESLPNWRDLNNDPGFLAWLALPDPYSGDIRHELLKRAHGRNDAPRVLNFFKGFLAEEAAVNGPAKIADQPAATPPAPKVPLETFAAPGRAKTAATPVPAEKPVITRASITKFYADVAAGKWRGRDAEKAQMDREIFLAGKEGRIR